MLSALALCAFALNAYSYVPGTCTATAKGNGGDIPVSVTFSKDRIEMVAVGENQETSGVGQTAMEELSSLIVQTQSLGMDAIAGATITSNAIFEAVGACIVEHGGDLAAVKAVKIAPSALTPQALETDIIVVGAGAAGQAAAIRASELGKKVVLVEKQRFTGGAAAVNAGQVIIQGSKIQKEHGVKDDSPELMEKDLMANGHDYNDKRMLAVYANNVGPTIDWATEKVGMKLNTEKGFVEVGEHSKPRVMSWVDGSAGANKSLKEAVAKSGTEVLVGTPAEKLIYEKGKVVGVQARAQDGTEYTIYAPVVILATGGYGANKEMLHGSLKNALYYGVKSSNGEGHKMAMEVGANTQLMDKGKIYPNGLEVAPGQAKSTATANRAALYQHGAIFVNQDGKRVVNETASGHKVKTEQEKQGGTLYMFMDQPAWDAFTKELRTTGITSEEVEKWLKDETKKPPIVMKGNTIEEVANKAGVNGAELQKTVEKYNGYVDKAKDEEFNRPAKFMKAHIAPQGPYFIVEQKPRFATTMGGVVTNELFQIENKKGEPIPGLYAAGELVGGVMGDDSPVGGNMGWALTSGKLAAESAAKTIE